MKSSTVLMTLLMMMGIFFFVGSAFGESKWSQMDPHHGYHHGGCWNAAHGGAHGGFHGKGMMWHGRGGAVAKKPHGWHGMSDEQKELWNSFVAEFNTEALAVRQQLAVKKLELEALWSQPDVDQEKVEKLSEEVADLKAELWKMHDKYVVKCRKEFGDKGWQCPGHGW